MYYECLNCNTYTCGDFPNETGLCCLCSDGELCFIHDPGNAEPTEIINLDTFLKQSTLPLGSLINCWNCKTQFKKFRDKNPFQFSCVNCIIKAWNIRPERAKEFLPPESQKKLLKSIRTQKTLKGFLE